jgi:hypothetical protein
MQQAVVDMLLQQVKLAEKEVNKNRASLELADNSLQANKLELEVSQVKLEDLLQLLAISQGSQTLTKAGKA